jgi:hypothetical protein
MNIDRMIVNMGDNMIEVKRLCIMILSEHSESVMGSFQNSEKLGLGRVSRIKVK